MRVAVAVATLGRPDETGQLLERISRQTHPAAAIVVSVERDQDLPAFLPPDVIVVRGERGLCAQRNRALDRVLTDCDVVVFFDDDYLPSRHALAGLSALFHRRPDVAGATGEVLADGVGTGGLSLDAAQAIVDRFDAAPSPVAEIQADIRTAYGCNMAFRAEAIVDLRFDERLPLYGWQEDVDFAARVAKRGRMVKTNAFAGVHRGVTRGRSPGAKLGFSQIVNPAYLMRKGTMRTSHALSIMGRNLLANHMKAVVPEAYVDRRGRLRGNWLGLAHLVSGKADPMQMLNIR